MVTRSLEPVRVLLVEDDEDDAEGIECPDQLRRLRALGCELGQGGKDTLLDGPGRDVTAQ